MSEETNKERADRLEGQALCDIIVATVLAQTASSIEAAGYAEAAKIAMARSDEFMKRSDALGSAAHIARRGAAASERPDTDEDACCDEAYVDSHGHVGHQPWCVNK